MVMVAKCKGGKQYSDMQMIAALKKTKGLVFLAAKVIGCNPDTIYERAKTSEVIATAIKTERGQIIDTAEEKLFKAVQKNEAWAIAMVLKTLGKCP